MSRTLEIVQQSVRTKGRDTKVSNKTGFLDLSLVAVPTPDEQTIPEENTTKEYEIWTADRSLQSRLRREAREGRAREHTVADVEEFDAEAHLDRMLAGKSGKKWKFWA